MNKVTFLGEECNVMISRFASTDRIALYLEDSMGCPMTRISVNMPDAEMADDETAIKNHSENEGILQILIDAGIVSEPVRYIKGGWVEFPVCKVLV